MTIAVWWLIACCIYSQYIAWFSSLISAYPHRILMIVLLCSHHVPIILLLFSTWYVYYIPITLPWFSHCVPIIFRLSSQWLPQVFFEENSIPYFQPHPFCSLDFPAIPPCDYHGFLPWFFPQMCRGNRSSPPTTPLPLCWRMVEWCLGATGTSMNGSQVRCRDVWPQSWRKSQENHGKYKQIHYE